MSRSGGARASAFSRAPFVLAAVLAMLQAPPAAAQPKASPGAIRIHVRGSAQINATATTEPSGLVTRGEVIDDAGAPVPGATLSLRAVGPDGSTALPLPDFSACDATSRRSRRAVRRTAPDEYAVDTDDRGAFCVRAATSLGQATLKLRFTGDDLRDPSESTVALDAVDASAARTILRFEPAVDVLDLDREKVSIAASLRVDRSGPARAPAGATRREGLTITLEDERGERIAQGMTGGDGRVRFELPTASLPGPGAGELRLRFEGTAGLAKASSSQPIVRRAEARLALAHPVDTGDPEDGVAIDVDVTTARGPVSGGVVEALRGNESVGAGSVQDGKAHVIASFSADREVTVPLVLRYVPAAPFYRAGATLPVEVRITGPGIARQILAALLVLGVTAWIVVGWRRAPMPKPKCSDDTSAVPSGRAGIEVVRAAAGQSGWRGTVLDAHDGTPVAGARLVIVAPAFQGDGVVARVTADERGEFVLDAPHRSDARLVVEADAHSRHEQALPPPSVLRVALITRRRALLERMIRWARRHGTPFDAQPEPTPGHVRRAAARSNALDIESWARSVEQAVYGPATVDEDIESKIGAAEPRGVKKPVP
ncbi:carboxypeptidase-like regulatory domain-containing protein [Polyangium aurulentum]|uniref:carboxypeptidase-like regulatory domain-containing protein n=1 Tax=Polyangium aurulentum TaxID=2567896 RepID=UPI0010ADE3AD|nr:carboxypeptidase-like regulatory domain-containing protein [Polyangium aurulentum]UQA58230.1 carboxypeptidase-like regulatory domain-containing protein [Polyangium aurulentum]